MALARRSLLHAVVFAAILGCTLAVPVLAETVTTTLTTAQLPANYAGPPAVGGLYEACKNIDNPKVGPDYRAVLITLTPAMYENTVAAITSGQYYIGGYYDTTKNTWYWDGYGGTQDVTAFALGPTATPVNTAIASDWAAGYPKMQTGTSVVGTLKYMAYDAALKGWINVDGTAALNGVACTATTVVSDDYGKSKFPWWAILIIVLGSVAIIAVVVVIVVCCCCCKKTKKYTDDEDESSFGSRSGSFSSRGTSHSGSSYTGTGTSSSTFSSRGSCYSGTSKSSGVTGSSGSSSTGSSVTGSSASSRTSGSRTDASSTHSGSSSECTSSTASSTSGRYSRTTR